MRPTFLLAVLCALALLPLALAHEPRGTPKLHCESWDEARTHEYLPVAAGLTVWGFTDGNVDDCDGDGTPYDDDGHSEWSTGGAWILADSGDGWSYGSIACFGEWAHHPSYGPFWIRDAAFTSNVHFLVAADLDGGWAWCGDFHAETVQHCIDACTVDFPPGIDGSYLVIAGHTAYQAPNVDAHVATQGHVTTP